MDVLIRIQDADRPRIGVEVEDAVVGLLKRPHHERVKSFFSVVKGAVLVPEGLGDRAKFPVPRLLQNAPDHRIWVVWVDQIIELIRPRLKCDGLSGQLVLKRLKRTGLRLGDTVAARFRIVQYEYAIGVDLNDSSAPELVIERHWLKIEISGVIKFPSGDLIVFKLQAQVPVAAKRSNGAAVLIFEHNAWRLNSAICIAADRAKVNYD